MAVIQWGKFKSIQDATQYKIYCLTGLIHHTFTICLGCFSAQSFHYCFCFIVWLPSITDAVQLQCHDVSSDQLPGSYSVSDQLIYDPEISRRLKNHWQVLGILTVSSQSTNCASGHSICFLLCCDCVFLFVFFYLLVFFSFSVEGNVINKT